MKALRINFEHRNTITFLIFSIVYLQAIYSLSLGISPLNIVTLRMFLSSHYIIVFFSLISIYAVITMKKHSEKVLLITLLLITSKNFILLSASFNKLILGLSFSYLVFAFYFYITWELETRKASHNPRYSKFDLEIESRFPLIAKLEDLDGGVCLDVLITNIDDESCFLFLKDSNSKAIVSELDAQAKYQITAVFEEIKFIQEARLASLYDRGVGLVLIKERLDDRTLNWSDLYKVCLDRGLFS